jgi:putative ATP-dependent endonuclease of OLD family
MKITRLRLVNYRTFEDIDLDFPASFAAICGPNDAGKTNVVRAISALMNAESETGFVRFNVDGQQDVSAKDDYPKWKEDDASKREIILIASLAVDRTRDAGFFEFLTKQLSITPKEEILDIDLGLTYLVGSKEPAVRVVALGMEFVGLEAQEVLKRIRSSKTVLFHNSTEAIPRFFSRNTIGSIRPASAEQQALLDSMKKTVNKGLGKISKEHQSALESVLGRLEAKHKVGLSTPTLDFDDFPFTITLSQGGTAVPLDDWGSGTRNRTLILMALFRAVQIGDSEVSASKITPVIIVEEPESFLHPSAQAEFGRVLRTLAEEFRVQVIVTTHSLYLLSMDKPESNILLCRKTLHRQQRHTERLDTSGDNWMEPFVVALGLKSQEFRAWKGLIVSEANAILLVEGATDKEYFEMLRDESHGNHCLNFSGEIVPYDGTGSLSNTVLLRFVKNRYKRLFVTFDLDAAQRVEQSLNALGLERKKNYMPIGLDAAGKKNIEGLLPERITKEVYAANSTLVQAATAGTREEQESARNQLKKLLLDQFKETAKPGTDDFGHFYPLVKLINSSLSEAN